VEHPFGFFEAMERSLSPFLGKQVQPPDYVCDNYSDLEEASMLQDESMLDAASSVLHRLTPRPSPPVEELTFCSLNVTHLLSNRYATEVFHDYEEHWCK